MKLKNHKPILIVGLQKSGTSLAFRLLKEQDIFSIPFSREGRYFWGDDPPFSPSMFPAGYIYQQHNGIKGHELISKDSDSHLVDVLLERLKNKNIHDINWLNKNPYNTVRINWLRTLFPECYIIAIYRKPESNIFSLLKKHIPHKNRGLGPERGWWGVKPNNWELMIHKDIIQQLANQWNYTNSYILNVIDNINLLVDYEDLCNYPNDFINTVLNHHNCHANIKFDRLTCTNNEYKTGSNLLSKNKNYQNKLEGLYLSEKQENEIELKPFTLKDRIKIKYLCQSTWKRCNKYKTKFKIS